MSHICREDMLGFDRLLALPRDDPERAAVEACPRCSARFLEFQAFLRASDAPGADVAGAQARLTQLVRAGGAAAGGGAARHGRGGAILRRWFSGPRLLVPAMAVVAIAVLGIWLWRPATDRSPEVRSTAARQGVVTILAAQATGDGVLITCEPVTGADGYVVRLLRADVTETARVGPVAAPEVRVALADVPEDCAYFEVVALRAGDVVAVSTIRALPGPGAR